jgi:hypothetical protein
MMTVIIENNSSEVQMDKSVDCKDGVLVGQVTSSVEHNFVPVMKC